ncbi:MAG: VOC family protein [Rubripirellula sp.]
MAKSDNGSVSWLDLTVKDADSVRDFYEAVVGWSSGDVEMDGYSDFNMFAGDPELPVAGICHARGSNEGIPPHWMIYINVDDLDQSVLACEARGGEVVRLPSQAGSGRIAMIRDPAGACVALYQAEST